MDSKWIDNFDFSPIEINGKTYQLVSNQVKDLESKGNYWHSKASPSSWLSVSIFSRVQRLFSDLNEKPQLQIAASLLGVSPRKLIDTIKWNDNYMTFHDGMECKTLKEDHDDI